MNKISIRSWRLINAILISLGLILPWVRFNFDAQYAPASPAVWIFIFSAWQDIIDRLSKHGFELLMLPFWFITLSGILIILYVIFNLFSVISRKNHKNNKVISILLLGTLVTFLFLAFVGVKPALGYWLFNLGIFSSAILEWQKGGDQVV